MKKPSRAMIDKRIMYDLVLMQQAALVKIKDRADRRASRDALQGLFIDLQTAIAPQLTLEIGAMDAAFSRKMAASGITAYAFEANSYNFAKFGPKIAALGLPVHYTHMAICDVDGQVQFQLRKTVDGKDISPIQGNNSLMQRNKAMAEVEYETITVPACKLDTFLTSHDLGKKTFSAWIDVEGALSRVTAGFGAALRHCQSILVELEEISYWDGQMLYADAMDYFIGQGFVPVARDFEARHQFNVLFLAEKQMQSPKVRAALTKYFANL
jgi:FkbM family methyltransferase